jgi:amphi-Trp domain-containing protein
MSEAERFVHESMLDKRSIQQFFLKLVDGIENGRVTLTAEKDQVLLAPAELLRLSIKVKKKTGKSKMTIKLTWNDSFIAACRNQSNEIRISS